MIFYDHGIAAMLLVATCIGQLKDLERHANYEVFTELLRNNLQVILMAADRRNDLIMWSITAC